MKPPNEQALDKIRDQMIAYENDYSGVDKGSTGIPILLKIASEQMAGMLSNPDWGGNDIHMAELGRKDSATLVHIAMDAAEALIAEYNRRQEK